jgi:hypothetical protein
VLEGSKTEREVALERDKKALETRLAELEDQNSQLKQLPKEKKPKKARPFFETVLDDDED